MMRNMPSEDSSEELRRSSWNASQQPVLHRKDCPLAAMAANWVGDALTKNLSALKGLLDQEDSGIILVRMS